LYKKIVEFTLFVKSTIEFVNGPTLSPKQTTPVKGFRTTPSQDLSQSGTPCLGWVVGVFGGFGVAEGRKVRVSEGVLVLVGVFVAVLVFVGVFVAVAVLVLLGVRVLITLGRLLASTTLSLT